MVKLTKALALVYSLTGGPMTAGVFAGEHIRCYWVVMCYVFA